MKRIFLAICCFAIYKTVCGLSLDSQGPVFIMEPRALTEFSNETGALLQCLAHGSPAPKIEWTMGDGSSVVAVANIREILPNGSLHFPPFGAESYRHDVHSAVYRCEAINKVGRIFSKEANVRAVVTQRYDIHVNDAFVIIGNTGVLKCDIPTFVRDYVTVTSWIQNNNFNIYPAVESDAKHQMLPSGELLVHSVTPTDSHGTYRCRTVHRVTGRTIESITHGRVVITEHPGKVAPRYVERISLHPVREGDTAVLSCISQGYPPPRHWWFRKNRYGLEPLMKTERIHIRGSVVLIESAAQSDAGVYLCAVNNSAGTDRVEHNLHVLQPITIHVNQPIATVDLGKNVDLLCASSGNPAPVLQWAKDGIPLREGSSGRKRTFPISSGLRLRIGSIQREDQGMYQCFAKNDYEMIQATTEVRLGDVYPQLFYKFIEQTMQPGPSVSLKCIATGNPTPHFEWTLDGFKLPVMERLMIGQYLTVHGDVISHVNISAVRVEDGGEYRCVASNRVGSVAHAARLNIYGLPQIRPMPVVSAVAGKDLTIKCPVAGYPISLIQWEKNERLLPINRRQEVSPNGTMVIYKVDSTTDRGTYTCTAKNKQGHSDRQSVEIDIKVPPKIEPFSFPSNVQQGSRVHVTCVVSDGDTPLKIRWMKDGRPVQEHQPLITTHQIGEFDLALRITSASTGHNGNYTCTADNAAASSSHTASLLVHVPPRIAPFSFNKDLSEGVRAQVTCVIEKGDPPFEISWLKDYKPIPPTLEIKIIPIDDHSSTIVLERITSKHTGNFTCQAKNPVAEVSQTAELVVSVPPRWLIEPQDQQAPEGIPVYLDCQADGFPLPRIVWRKSVGRRPGNYRDLATHESGMRVHSNGTLVIHHIKEDHEGFYLCEAINNIGPGISKVIYFTVNAPAQFVVKSKNQTTRLGLPTTLRCDARGDRPINIVWRKAGSLLEPASDYRISIKEINVTESFTSELTISTTNRDDSGRYFCVASNAFGRDEMSLQLFVQEPPEFPRNLHVLETHSRAIKVGWILSQDGNSPIKHYVVEYKIAAEPWMEQQTENFLVSGKQAMASVGPLKPSTTYQVRLFAENDLGRSLSSDVLDVTTVGEPPNGSPTKLRVQAKSSVALQVNWFPPEHEFWNGDILGYHVGYREASHTVEKTQFITVEGLYLQGGECTINKLKKFTNYNVQVQAFNALGPGPMTDDVASATKEDVPTAPPQEVRCTALSSQSLQVHWEPPPESEVHGILKGYKVVWENAEIINELITPDSQVVSALTFSVYNLEKYTNYSVQVLAFTVVGDGVLSLPFYCVTEEDVPGSPAAIKAVAKSSSAIVVSWLPPTHPNAVIITYNLYVRILNSNGIETKTYKRNLSNQQTYYEAEELNKRGQYEFSVTAISKVGEGPKSTSVIQSTQTEAFIKAEIFTFGQQFLIHWQQDVRLPCKYVGKPDPTLTWKLWGQALKPSPRTKILPDGSLLLKDVRREESGNYTCTVANAHSTDRITHRLTVQVPPSAPLLHATGVTMESISIQWKQGDNGGDYVRGFQIFKKCDNKARSNGDWEGIRVGYRTNSQVLENLWCGSQYQIYMQTFSNVGAGPKSDVITVQTKGSKPGHVSQERLIFVNTTTVNIYLNNWEDGGCPMTRFEIKYKRRDDEEWIEDQNEIKLQKKYEIKNLLPATQYEMEIKAHNDAGVTIGEFKFQTLSMDGDKIDQVETATDTKVKQEKDLSKTPFYYDWWIIVCGSLFSSIGIIIALVAIYKCIKKEPPASTDDICLEETIVIQDNKTNFEQREHYYATVRKPMHSPVRDMAGNVLERIPENSEDIYPYATFELNEQPPESHCTSAAPMQTFVYHDQRMSAADTLQVRESDSDHYSKAKRSRRKSRSFKSESEEYDTLGSDSDTEQGTSSRTESSNHLDGPGPSRERSGSQPFTRRSRITHNTMFHGPESSTSTEPSPIYERRSFPRRGRPQMLQLASHSIETGRSGVSRDSSSSSFFFPAKLEPPTGFSDSIELSEAECDLDVARGLRMLQLDMRRPPSFRASKRRGNHQDFTIAV